MPHHSRLAIIARVGVLPLLLALAVVLGLGSYTETSDDHTLAWLFAGVLATKPVASLPLYFHGYGHVLAAAYTAAPAVPWLGLLLGGLLAGATSLFFAVLDRVLRPHLAPAKLTVVLVVFFAVAWLEHWLWFSHVRVGVLLAGAAVLYAAQRPGQRGPWLLGLAGLGAAWLIRPSVAVLGAGAVLPAAVLLAGSWRRAAPLLLSVGLGLALATGAATWQRTPAEARTQAQDRQLARILDYEQLVPVPHSPADRLGTAAVAEWLFGDAREVNEALFQRAYRFDAARFWGRTVPGKLRLRAGLLLRDYFPLLLALAAVGWRAARRQPNGVAFWVVQAGFGGGLLVLAGVLKLPPRLELPLLDFWLLTNLALWLGPVAGTAAAPNSPAGGLGRRAAAGWRRVAVVAGLVVLGLYGAKTWHRRQVLSREQLRHETALADLAHRQASRVRVLAGVNDLLKSLSPFRTYSLGHQPVLLLTGWQSYDASQAELRRSLSGAAGQAECLRRLARLETTGSEAQVLWVLTPPTAAWLNQRLGPAGRHLSLSTDLPGRVAGTDSLTRVYRAR